MALESWLSSDDHEKAGTASAMCANPSGSCLISGKCEYGGECFEVAGVTIKEMQELNKRVLNMEKKIENIHWWMQNMYSRVNNPPGD